MAKIISIVLIFCFCIPSIGTESPLRSCDGTLAQRQAIVDTENLALYQKYGNGHLIADHAGSEVGGIWDMSLLSVGDIGMLYQEDGVRYYECIAIAKCRRGQNSYNWHKRPFLPDKNDIVCISCVDETGDWVWAAYFDYCFTDYDELTLIDEDLNTVDIS